MKASVRMTSLALLLSGSAAALAATPVDGRWDAQLVRGESTIPFRLDISSDGGTVKGTFYDGFKPYEYSTSASFKDGKLVLNIEHYLTSINAELKDGKLVGQVFSQSRSNRSDYGFAATRHDDAAYAKAVAAQAPNIAGDWEIPLAATSAKGEKAFHFIVEQHGAEVAASILRIDGDTGAYSGVFKDGKWQLSHFDGSRPGNITVSQNSDGTLQVIQGGDRGAARRGAAAGGEEDVYSGVQNGRNTPVLVAYRPDVARAKGLPAPDQPLTHTTARDAKEKFAFNFKDLYGKQQSQDDPYYKGQVVLAIVTGTWCPNCHDEAQYLVELDKKYRDKGLRIVALDFEEVEQQASLERAKAFVTQYGVKYPYLVAGAPEEMWEKVPQLVNLNTWPATVFVGRDGTVRAVHAGFASLSTGDLRTKQDNEFTQRIEALLAEKAAVDTRVSANIQ
ncbi:MAG: TlpA disulfide reductase family protein [Pseudomonadota bacterium]